MKTLLRSSGFVLGWLALVLVSGLRAQTITNYTQVTNNSSTQFLHFNSYVYLTYWDPFVGDWAYDYVPINADLAPSASHDYVYDAMAADSWLQSVAQWAHVSPASLMWSWSMSMTSYNHYTLSMTAPSSSNQSISSGNPFTAPNSGGSGGTTRVWVVAGYTNWQTGSWTPPGPGTYTFYVGLLPSPGYVGNETDPLIGPIMINYTSYTLTVN